MKMEPLYDKNFLRRYKAGKCTQGEIEGFVKWLESNPEQREVPWMKNIWEESSENKTIILGGEQKIFNKILDRIAVASIRKQEDHYPIYLFEKNILHRQYFLRYASIILIFLIPFLITKMFMPPSTHSEKIVYIKKSTGDSGHLTFKLEDGTTIILNSNSEITYPEHFTDSSRIVTLAGEAFFDVAKDKNRHFSVVTGDISTTALGTSFNICFNEKKPVSKISLVSGAVRVKMKNENGAVRDVYLEPGKQAICNPSKGTIETSIFDPLETTGWKDGILYFKSDGIDDVVDKLESWYGVKITITGNSAIYNKSDWSYSGIFQNQTLENVLRGIGYVKDFSFEIEGKNVKIMFNQKIKSHEIANH